MYMRPSNPINNELTIEQQCAAHRFALPHLQALALRKQGLQSGIHASTILSSARYAYSHTPASDTSLRAHYLALIIRSRATFKRSGTMQAEMMAGGSALWFDLFVAMVEHLVSTLSQRSYYLASHTDAVGRTMSPALEQSAEY
jgi:hypothetical protein